MKTPREFAAQWTELPMPARSSLEIATNNRDAEHRAELLKLQDDLLQAANREVMTAALIERLRGERGECEAAIQLGREGIQAYCDSENAMREKLDRAVTVLRECVAMMRIQEKRSSGEFHLSAEAFVPMWSSSLDAADKFLAAPPPAESRCTASAGSCNSPRACGEAGKCIDARMREFVAPAEPTPVLCEQHGREDCPRPDHAGPPGDIRERLDGLGRRISGLTADCDSDNRRIDDHERRLAALEAKGESGTHCCVAERCTEWRLP